MDFRRHSIVELRDLLRAGAISASALTEHSLQRIDDLDGSVHAFSEVLAEEAIVTAKAISAHDPRPLAGIPIAIKANREVEGALFNHASRALSNRRSVHDCLMVQRIRSAGMIIIGVTTTSEFCLLPSTESALLGRTLNPRMPGHSAGGSSGGSAAAVASGMVPVATGNDAAGSLRIPAAWCGQVGFAMPSEAPEGLGAQEGVIANSVGDAFLVAREMGPGGVTDRVMERQSLVQLPIAIAHRSPIGLVGDQCDEAALAAASSLMNEDGLRTVDIDPPWATELALHMFALMAPRARHRISQEFGLSAEAMLAEQPLEAFTQQFLENAARVTESDHQRARDLASNFRSRMDSWITDFSMIMTTTTISGPPPLGSLSGSLSMHDAGPAISRATAFTWWTNVLGWASVSLPIHVDNASTPRAIQLCAPRQNIQDLYNVARLLSRQATSGFCAQGEVSGAQ